MIQRLKTLLRRADVEVGRYRNTYLARRHSLMDHHRIDLVVDIGANDGRWVSAARGAGYGGRILSLEPASAPFAQLVAAATGDPAWTPQQVAVGAETGQAVLNLSEDPIWSSFAPVLELSTSTAPEARYVAQETVEQSTLDDLLSAWSRRRLMIKMDVQGWEGKVFDGAESALSEAALVEVEMSPRPIYGDGQMLLPETVTRLADLGLTLVLVENLFHDRGAGASLAFNGLFARQEALPSSRSDVR